MERERERRRPDQPGSAAPALPTNADFGVDGADGRLPAARPGRDDGDGVIDLDGWLALRDLTLDQARVKLGVDGEPGVRYEGLRPVRRLHNPAVHPGHFYFDGNHQVMQYIGAAGLDGVDSGELERTLGGPGEILPSRAGKSSAMHVYPD